MSVMRPALFLAVVMLAVLDVVVTAQSNVRAVVYAGGFAAPLNIVQDPTNRSVQFVVEQAGRIRAIRAGAVVPGEFLNLSNTIRSGGEQGLLGLAFAPDYASSGRFYVNFTNRDGHTVIARFRRSSDPFVADPAFGFPPGAPDGQPDMLSWHVLWLPVVVVLQLMWLAGITWILSSLTVALPDVTYFVNLFVFLLMWVTPIGFKPEMVPAGFRFVLYLNPIFYMTEMYRASMLNGRFPSASVAAVYVVMCLATFALGSAFFERFKGVLTDYE